MFNDLKDYLIDICIPTLIISAIVLGSIILLAYLFTNTPMYKEHERVKQEWRLKVNNCVLNENYRKDCKLILYREAQINYQQVQDNQQTSVMTGAMVGSMVGASIGRR